MTAGRWLAERLGRSGRLHRVGRLTFFHRPRRRRARQLKKHLKLCGFSAAPLRRVRSTEATDRAIKWHNTQP